MHRSKPAASDALSTNIDADRSAETYDTTLAVSRRPLIFPAVLWCGHFVYRMTRPREIVDQVTCPVTSYGFK
jgi:hypothetical protein